MSKLNDRQRLFVAEYPVDLNATQAAIRAGYSPKTAYSQGQRLLKKVEVQAAVQKSLEQRIERTEITADRVLEELAKLGFSNMLDYPNIGLEGDPFVDLTNMTREQAAAVQEVTVEDFKDGRGEDARDVRRIKFKLADKKSSLELLGKGYWGVSLGNQGHTGILLPSGYVLQSSPAGGLNWDSHIDWERRYWEDGGVMCHPSQWIEYAGDVAAWAKR